MNAVQQKPKVNLRAPLGTVAKTAMLSYVVVWSCLAATDDRLHNLLGASTPFEPNAAEKTEDGINPFAFSLNDSLKELSRTDFDGMPKFLERGQRHFVVGALYEATWMMLAKSTRLPESPRKRRSKASKARSLSTSQLDGTSDVVNIDNKRCNS